MATNYWEAVLKSFLPIVCTYLRWLWGTSEATDSEERPVEKSLWVMQTASAPSGLWAPPWGQGWVCRVGDQGSGKAGRWGAEDWLCCGFSWAEADSLGAGMVVWAWLGQENPQEGRNRQGWQSLLAFFWN